MYKANGEQKDAHYHHLAETREEEKKTNAKEERK